MDLQNLVDGIGRLESEDDFIKLIPYEPNHLFFLTRFGDAGYFDIRADDDGVIKLFRNKRLGVPDEPPILPDQLLDYLQCTSGEG